MKGKFISFIRRFRVLKHPFACTFFIIMILYSLSLIIPVVWLFSTTLKDTIGFDTDKVWFPQKIYWGNYANVFSKMYTTVGIKKFYVPQLMLNGLLIAIVPSLTSLFVQCLVAYACAKFNTFVCKILYGIAIVTMILPTVGTLSSSILLYKTLHLYDNFFGLTLAYSGWGGTNFLLLCATFKSISNTYREAAQIDGASQFRIFFTIMMPMIKTTLSALFILAFIASWNDYQTPMVYIPSMPTIAYGLFTFRNSSDSLVSSIPMQVTGSIIVMIPIFILFMLFRNKIMGNLALGGLKG